MLVFMGHGLGVVTVMGFMSTTQSLGQSADLRLLLDHLPGFSRTFEHGRCRVPFPPRYRAGVRRIWTIP
jgi:hypothetical protein